VRNITSICWLLALSALALVAAGCPFSGRVSGLDNSRNLQHHAAAKAPVSQGDHSTSFILQNIDFGPIASTTGLGLLGLMMTMRSRKYRRVTELLMDSIEVNDGLSLIKQDVTRRSLRTKLSADVHAMAKQTERRLGRA